MKHGLSKIGLEFRWPRITGLRGVHFPSRSQLPSLPTAIITLELVETPVAPETPARIAVEAPSPPPPPPQKQRDVPVRVIPPRQKRQKRAPEVVQAAPPPPEPKSLKVIRRRKEQAPKVFETPPKEFPDVILSGFHLTPEEDAAK